MANFGTAVDIDLLEQDVYNSGSQNEDLSGTISSMPSSRPARRTPLQDVDLNTEFDTLDEPVYDTIMRDVKAVSAKFGHVIFPKSSEKQLLKDWDLWGPLFICVALSLLLHANGDGEAAPQFTQVFSLTFFGACIVTMNIKLLGGQISFFQSLCVIGYCLLPPSFSAVVCSIVLHGKLFMLRLLLTAVGFLWATYAAMGFLADTQPPKRRLLVVYPVFLFYFVVSWLILSHT